MNDQLTPEQFFARLFRDEDQRDARSRGPIPLGQGSTSLLIDLERGSDGRIVRKIEADGQGRDATVYDYVYDEGGRLALVLRDGVEVERYEYDAAGRRIAACCEASSMRHVELEYDGMRLARCGDTSYAYADDGTLRELRGREGSLWLLYGSDTGLDKAVLPDGRVLTWDTDAKTGLPLAKYEDGALVERFAWRDLLRLERYEDLRRGVRQHYHYDEHSRLPHTITERNSLQSRTYTLGYDQVGTLKTVADNDGKLVKKRQYDSFGNLLRDSNPNLYIAIGFAGGLHDGDTSLVRFGHRHYDPHCGRFVAQDPLGDTGGDHDLYEYCVDDPINAIDPLGLWSIESMPAWVGAGVKKAKDFFGFTDEASTTVKSQRKTHKKFKEGVDMINTDPDKAIHKIWEVQDMQIQNNKQILKTLIKGAKVAR